MRALAILLLFVTGGVQAGRTDSLLHALKDQSGEERARTLSKLVTALVYAYPDSAMTYAREYLAYAEGTNDEVRMGTGNNQLGLCLRIKGDHAAALPHHLRALELFEHLNDDWSVAVTRGHIAEVYSAEGRYDRALEEWRSALSGYTASKDTMGIAISSEAMARMFEQTGKKDSAFAYYGRVADLMLVVGSPQHAGMMRYQRSLLMENVSDTTMLRMQEEALHLLGDPVDKLGRAIILEGLGRTRLRMGHYEEAERLLREALGIAVRRGFTKNRAEIHAALSTLYEKQHQADSALVHLQAYTQWHDTVFTQERSERIAEVQTRSDSARKDAELERRNALIAQQDARMALYLGSAVVLLVVAIALVIGYRRKRRYGLALEQRNAAVEAALKEKELLLRELHHRVKNNMQTVGSLLRLQARNVSDEGTRRALQEAMMRVKSLALVHQDLYKDTVLASVSMDLYMTKLANGLLRSHGMEERVALMLNVAPVRLEVDSAVPLGLILNELITNALKHAFPGDRTGSLFVVLKDQDEMLLLEVRDDGIGYHPQQEGSKEGDALLSGAGIVGMFAEALQAKWTVMNEEGTTVRFAVRNFTRA
jgi:two-component system, sensor histidine kinase PdtaS